MVRRQQDGWCNGELEFRRACVWWNDGEGAVTHIEQGLIVRAFDLDGIIAARFEVKAEAPLLAPNAHLTAKAPLQNGHRER